MCQTILNTASAEVHQSNVDLSRFDNSWYEPGRPWLVQVCWHFLGAPLLGSTLIPFSAIKRWILRLFGATVNAGVIIKPGVKVKYPWRLRLGAHAWLGENAWIDNLGDVDIEANACISQGVYLCTGNHDWSDPTFGLLVKGIRIGRGAWVGAQSVVCPGVELGENAIASSGCIVTKSIPPGEIHAGNPARFVRNRVLH